MIGIPLEFMLKVGEEFPVVYFGWNKVLSSSCISTVPALQWVVGVEYEFPPSIEYTEAVLHRHGPVKMGPECVVELIPIGCEGRRDMDVVGSWNVESEFERIYTTEIVAPYQHAGVFLSHCVAVIGRGFIGRHAISEEPFIVLCITGRIGEGDIVQSIGFMCYQRIEAKVGRGSNKNGGTLSRQYPDILHPSIRPNECQPILHLDRTW